MLEKNASLLLVMITFNVIKGEMCYTGILILAYSTTI